MEGLLGEEKMEERRMKASVIPCRDVTFSSIYE